MQPMIQYMTASVVCMISTASLFGQDRPSPERVFDSYREAATEKWTETIDKLVARDRAESHSDRAVLFVGSSSIRLWSTIAEDMAPYEVIQRGYGGAKLSDLGVFVDRIVSPHQVQAIVLFVANDISGKDTDATPEHVLELFKANVAIIRKSHPTTPLFYIAVTPTQSRFDHWSRIAEGNALIRSECESAENLHFISTAKAFLTIDGVPNDRLFLADRLHLNEKGYDLWASKISAVLALAGIKPDSE